MGRRKQRCRSKTDGCLSWTANAERLVKGYPYTTEKQVAEWRCSKLDGL